jgi:hypothetical protein
MLWNKDGLRKNWGSDSDILLGRFYLYLPYCLCDLSATRYMTYCTSLVTPNMNIGAMYSKYSGLVL